MNGTNEEKHNFLYMKSIPMKTDMINAEEGARKSRTALYVAGGLAFLNSVFVLSNLVGAENSREKTFLITLTATLGVVFIVLAILHKKHRFAISVAGLILAIVFMHGSLIGIATICALAYGAWCAYKYDSAKRKYEVLAVKMNNCK